MECEGLTIEAIIDADSVTRLVRHYNKAVELLSNVVTDNKNKGIRTPEIEEFLFACGHATKENTAGDPLENYGDFVCKLNYWDCECQDDYIHHRDVEACPRCGTLYEDAPPSRENEVQYLRQHGSMQGYGE